MAEHMQRAPQLFPQILNTLFEIVLFEDCANQWSLSRPMLSLILILEALYGQLRAQLIASQPGEARQRHLAQCLDRLMADVQRNLEPKNRDKFTQVTGGGGWGRGLEGWGVRREATGPVLLFGGPAFAWLTKQVEFDRVYVTIFIGGTYMGKYDLRGGRLTGSWRLSTACAAWRIVDC